jgi:hypothetical protein
MYSNKRITLNYATDMIVSKLDKRTSILSILVHKTNKKRKKKRKEYLSVAEEDRRCVVAYGDASISATTKSRIPIPVKVIVNVVWLLLNLNSNGTFKEMFSH